MAKLDKLQAKRQALEAVQHEVNLYDNYIELLRSIHKECSPTFDWFALRNAPAPIQPVATSQRETVARQAHDAYVPSFWDHLFRRVDARRAKLTQAISTAQQADTAGFVAASAQFETAHRDWIDSTAFAQRILTGDGNAYLEAIEETNPFGEIRGLGSTLRFTLGATMIIEAIVVVSPETTMPQEVKKVLQSGKLSVKKMSLEDVYALHKDYVCGCVLRVARELLALLPVDRVLVTAEMDLLNTATGHLTRQPILSVFVPRLTAEKIIFNRTDPADALRTFFHRMEFKRTKGFGPIRPITSTELQG